MTESNNIEQTHKSTLGDLGGLGGIIFDLDGTLLDSVTDIATANNRVLEQNGLPTHSVEKYIEFIGNGARRLVQLALPVEWQKDDEKVDEYLEQYKIAYKQNIVERSRLFEGIPELLAFLNKLEIPVCINTNKPHDQTLLIAEKLLSDYHFEIILGQSEQLPRKPDPAGALWIAEKLNVSPSDVLFVGDSAVDVNTALAAKMQLICVDWGYSPKQEMIDAGCKHFVSTAEELKTFIIKSLP